MNWLNYHHLLYFYVSVKEGGVSAAARKLRLAQPTISGQIKQLEERLGAKLFTRKGRNLQLTDAGQHVYRYADEIFSLGNEMLQSIHGGGAGARPPLVVGVANVLPKLLVYQFVRPALELADPVEIVCRVDRLERLLGDLAIHGVDLVLADSPIMPTVSVRAFNHQLGESTVSFMATKALASKYRKRFPESLDGAPMLLPAQDTVLRRSLEQWFRGLGVEPIVVGEFEDSALKKSFGQAGAGIFATPTAAEHEVRRQYGVGLVGRSDAIREKFYAITVERRLHHPGVIAICERAKQILDH